ncbi:ferrous iron transport protein A [Comamonas sp. GB3 AK4-5]|uniref:FeoA family protein n=1 Tax=Comamonas sp. GB3 AK4-5 TaxID=3231487 RepID=UPI00351F347E
MQTLSSAAPQTAASAANSSPAAAVLGLDRLAPRVPARVVDLAPATTPEEQELLLRLMEIGFLPGESVCIVATGFPGPDPLAVRVGQARFALRRHEASKVLVQVEAQP